MAFELASSPGSRCAMPRLGCLGMNDRCIQPGYRFAQSRLGYGWLAAQR